MRVALLQSMYDEHANVLHNIKIVKSIYGDTICLVTHSFDIDSSDLIQIKQESYYTELPNLGGILERMKLPSYAISRNYSDLFNRLYGMNLDVDIIVALAGDTHLYDVYSIGRRYEEMQRFSYHLYACQAKGQYFWDANKNLSRFQSTDIADFMPQLFFVDGRFAKETKVFSNIQVVNEYTSEQCLSDEFLKYSSLDRIGMLNNDASNWASYQDGVIWQCMTGGRPGRP